VTETVDATLETAPASAGQRTIAQLWRNAVAGGRTGAAYLTETDDGWREVSWAEADERVRAYANGFLARQVRKGDNVALLARNGLEWALLDFALARIGAVWKIGPVGRRSGLGGVQALLCPNLRTRVLQCIIARCKSAQRELKMPLKRARYCAAPSPNFAKQTTEMIPKTWKHGSAIKQPIMCGPGSPIPIPTSSLQAKALLSSVSELSRLLAKSSSTTCRQLLALEA